jgi:hypothetical protein
MLHSLASKQKFFGERSNDKGFTYFDLQKRSVAYPKLESATAAIVLALRRIFHRSTTPKLVVFLFVLFTCMIPVATVSLLQIPVVSVDLPRFEQ